MSYTTQDAIIDWHNAVNTAINKRDSEALRKLAYYVDEEDAQPLLAMVRQWDNEDWAYDSAVDNSL